MSAALSATGAPAQLIRAAEGAEFELLVSPALMRELDAVLARPKIAELLEPGEAAALRDDLAGLAVSIPDRGDPSSITSPDPEDDFLLALAERQRVPLVTGDGALLKLADRMPILSPAEFLELLEERRRA